MIEFRVYDKRKFRFLNENDDFHLNLKFQINEHLTLQKYTGKRDIFGNKIFEGDVVDLSTQINEHKGMPSNSHGAYEVFYSDRAAAFYLRVIKKSWGDICFITQEEANKLTIDPKCPHIAIEESPIGDFNRLIVIGNIFHVIKCGCGGDVEYFGEALMGSLKCKSCGEYLSGVGHDFLKNKTILWYKGVRGWIETKD
jgi:uncharacterized phage protein (TIGR01671 family)